MISVLRLLRREAASIVAVAVCLSVSLLLAAIGSDLLWRAPNGVTRPDELVRVNEVLQSPTAEPVWTSLLSRAQVDLLAGAGPVVAGVATYACGSTTVEVDVFPSDIRVCQVSPGYFATLGTAHGLIGRLFDSTTSPRAAEIVLSAQLWRRLFQSDPTIVGQSYRVGGVPMVVSGVAPLGLRGIDMEMADAWTVSSAWRDAAFGGMATNTDPTVRSVTALLRLRSHVSRRAAASVLNAVYRSRAEIAGIHPIGELKLQPTSLTDRSTDSIPARVGIWAMVLLGISVVSVGISVLDLGVLLALRRAPQFRIRWILGADEGHLLRLEVTQTLWLTGSSTVIAVALADLCWHWLARGWLGRQVVFGDFGTLPVVVFGSVLIATIVSALLLPRVLLLNKDGSADLGERQSRSMPRAQATMRSILLGAAVAIFVVAIASSGGLARQIQIAKHARFGIDIDKVIVGTPARPLRFSSAVARDHAFEELRAFASHTPGVVMASLTNGLPFVANAGWSVRKPDGTLVLSKDGAVPWGLSVTPSFFETTGTHLIRGRTFSRSDSALGTSLIVSTTFARTAWPQQDPIGACLYMGSDTVCQPVIGIAEDARRRSVISELPELQVYLPLRPAADESPIRVLIVRASADDPSRVRDALRHAFVGIGGDAAAIRWQTLAEIVEPQWQPIVVALTLLSYATIAMAFSTAVMLYGIFGEIVARRRREFAIRLSIGASPSSVVTLLIRTTVIPVATGCLCGLFVLPYVTPLLNLPVRGLPAQFPTAIAAACVGLIAVLGIALVLPSMRILTIDPARELAV